MSSATKSTTALPTALSTLEHERIMVCRVWDGIDFTPCFRRTYIANVAVVLAGIAGLLVLVQLFRSRRIRDVSTADLVSPGGDNLVKLEARVLVSAIASTLKPVSPISIGDVESASESTPEHVTPAASGTPPTPSQIQRAAESTINTFRRSKPPAARRWETVYWVIGVLGAATLLGLQLYVAYPDRSNPTWHVVRPLVFPATLLLLALTRDAPLAALVTLYLVPEALLFRSASLSKGVSTVSLVILVTEVVYWAALLSVPYYDHLDELLSGAVSHGGLNVGKGLKEAIEEPTSMVSRGTYFFLLPFLWKHYWQPITLKDIPALREDDGAAASLGAFRAFQARKDSKYEVKYSTPRRRNLGIDLMGFFAPLVFKQCVFACLFIVLQYLPPTGLRLLLSFIKDRDTGQPLHLAALYIGMMALGQSMGVVVYGQALMLGRRVAIRMRAIIIAEVFSKALRREDRSGAVKTNKEGVEEAPESSSDGKISNIVAVDAFTISEVCAYVFYPVSCPVAIIINLTLLHTTLGPAAYAGVAMLLLLIPVQAVMGRLFTIYQARLMSATDKRLDVVTEVINFIKLIKYNSWQEKFFTRMSVTRRKELRALAQRFGLIVGYNTIIQGTPVLVTSAAFGVHVLVLKQPLTADRAFASLVLFNMLRDPLALMQDTISRLLQAYTSCIRIQSFLNEPETLKYKQISVPSPSDPSIGFRDALFAYPGQEEDDCAEEIDQFRLGELDLTFPTGQLSLVTGPVGSGKTTLILSLLGETVLLKGKIFIPDDMANRDLIPVDRATGLANTTAYCAQTAWLVGATIRENIVFGSAWDQARYDAVVDACALRRDFEIFDLGDHTEVGEKGTTCSGGQKARIALARAIYSPAKTVILDDVLSAVDAQTARHIFSHVLQGPLMKDRTCILVTHAVGLCLPAASFVVMLEDGQCVASGTPAELIASGHVPEEVEMAMEEKASNSGSATSTKVEDGIEKALDGEEHDILVAQKAIDAEAAGEGVIADVDLDMQANKQLVQEETSNQGAIGFSTYLLYFKALGGFWYWVTLIFALVSCQVLQYLTNRWVGVWSNAPSQGADFVTWVASLGSKHSAWYYLDVYLGLSGLFLVATAARVGISFIGSLRASSRLYKRMLKCLLGAKLRFFDSTPSGRIMNRLSKDISSIDQETTEILTYFINCVLSCTSVLIVVAWYTPAFLYAVPGITLMYWVVGTLYVTTSREVKRFDSITRSPIFVSFSEALVGMSTIRSYGDSARFLDKVIAEIDTNTRCFWCLWQANRILNNLSNFVGTIITVLAAVLALRTGADASTAGLSITYALSFTEYVLWVVRLYASAEMSMNSVERVTEYLDLEQEEPKDAQTVEPPAYWPSRDGSVIVRNLTCKYAPQLDPVLRDISFEIAPGEKIGVCGRTGSGKSTLALSFFRFLYQEGGQIEIDGIDISQLSLDTLRSRLTILPQEAQLFSGTIRENMDPFGEHEDVDVWEALRQVGLAGRTPGASLMPSRVGSRAGSRAVSRVGSSTDLADGEERVMIRSLDENVATGGKNFSQGQRQLLAMARGLLKLHTSSFLIMDESTANLDHATDATIQNVLRKGLADTQMVVIAHRLMTVCGLDKILVLDHGEVIEFGTPWELLQDENGSFRDLCRQSGEESQLFELAYSVHERKTTPRDGVQ